MPPGSRGASTPDLRRVKVNGQMLPYWEAGAAYLPYGKERWGNAAADGQMGVLVRLYVDWRLSGDLEWLPGEAA